jgi:hypothetical protein
MLSARKKLTRAKANIGANLLETDNFKSLLEMLTHQDLESSAMNLLVTLVKNSNTVLNGK